MKGRLVGRRDRRDRREQRLHRFDRKITLERGHVQIALIPDEVASGHLGMVVPLQTGPQRECHAAGIRSKLP